MQSRKNGKCRQKTRQNLVKDQTPVDRYAVALWVASACASDSAPLQGADGRYITRSYLDFYLGMGAVFIPAFDDAMDGRAAELIETAYPDREVVQLDMAEISHRGGAIHCMTQQQPKVR